MNTSARVIDCFDKLLPVVLAESERGAVLACSAYIEKQIKETLFPSCERVPFDSLVKLLGDILIQQELVDLLHILRNIRNDAVHHFTAFKLSNYGQTFSNNFVRKAKQLKVYKNLESAKTKYKGFIADGSPVETTFKDAYAIVFSKTKCSEDAFNFMVVSIVICSYLQTAEARRARLSTYLVPEIE